MNHLLKPGCRAVIAVCAALAFASPAQDTSSWKLPPETVKLRKGPNVELAVANCALCHSADYIATQPPMARTAWRNTVEKMRTKYGAPISTNNVDGLADYLVGAYGKK